MIKEESYEVQEEALGLLDRAEYDAAAKEAALQDLAAFRSLHMKDVHQRELADAAIEYLSHSPSFRYWSRLHVA